MRFAVFVFSILLIFSTTYAHAIAFVPAVVGGLVRTAGGQVMKVASKRGVVATASAALALYCKKNQKKCKDILGDAADYFFDDDDNDQGCFGVVLYDGHTDKEIAISNAIDKQIKEQERILSTKYTFISRTKDDFNYQTERAKKSIDEIKKQGIKSNYTAYVYRAFGLFLASRTIGNQQLEQSMSYSVSVVGKLVCNDVDKQDIENKKNEQLAKKIAEHLSDDDIDYIINNYSKEIEINIDKYCATAGACAELDQAFGDEVMNNKNKYDIDRINKDNCEVKNDKIISCDNAKIDKDDDDSDTPKDGDDGQDGDDTKPKDKDKPIKCDSSPFHKKVCDFIDWYYSDEYTQSDTKIDVQDDTPKPTNTNIDFNGSCPASYVVSHTLHFGMLGSYDLEFTLLDTPKLCGFLNDWIKPIMMFLGPLHAVYIIGKRDE